MTALPRNPIDVPLNPLQSQKAATGRSGAQSSELSLGQHAQGEAATSFSLLMGKLRVPQPQAEAPGEAALAQAQIQDSEEVAGLPDPASVQVDLEKSSALTAVSRIMEVTPLSDGRLAGFAQSAAPTSQSGGTSIGVLPGTQNDPAPATVSVAPEPNLKAGQVTTRDDLSVSLPLDGRANPAVEGRTEVKVVPVGDAAPPPTPIKAEQAVIARTDLAAARSEASLLDRRRSDPPAAPTPPPSAPTAVPQQTLPSARMALPQTNAAPVQLEAIGGPAPQGDPTTVNQGTLPGSPPPSTAGASDDLPRLQDVRITSSRIMEIAPNPSERIGQPTTVKVIDLQLQPDTLGRINAQLKQTAEGLEIRLEPSMAETALMLKEDRLALQRILGSLGSGTEPTVVRIVDPVGQREHVDGQDALADQELDQAGPGSDWPNTFDDLYAERRAGEEYQHVQPEDDQAANSGGRRRAAGDIYI